MMKGAGILAAARSLDDPKSITTNPELARHFCECTEMEVELLENLLRHGGTNHDDGVLPVVEKYALAKKSAYDSAAGQCDNLNTQLDECQREVVELDNKRSIIEEKRENIANAKATIDRRPEIVKIRKEIEGVEVHLANLVNKLKNSKAMIESGFDETLKELDDSSNRYAAEIIKEGKEFRATGVTLAENEAIRDEAKKDKDDFDVHSLKYILALGHYEESVFQNENIVKNLSNAFICGVEAILHDEETPIDRLFMYNLNGSNKNKFVAASTATILLRFLKNIGWEKSPEFLATKTKLIACRKKYQDDSGNLKYECATEMVLRLMQTLFVDNELPKSGKVLLNGLNAMKEDQEKAKAEQEETERKKFKIAPDSTQKRLLSDVNPLAGEVLAYIEHSAKKRRITATEGGSCREGYSSPVAKIRRYAFEHKTPPKDTKM